ncbi:MAG: hypothetical protein V1714_04500 [Pseudomonadota bacterium]
MGNFFQNDIMVDGLISRSGIISRQILKFYRFMRKSGSEEIPAHGVGAIWLRQHKIRRFLSAIGISKLADLLYTYYLGGSLTRQDQLTFARIHGWENRAYLLTGINALACGIPTAALYFLIGEGFQILSRVNSYTELPAILVSHTSLGIGTISLGVDLFRAADAFWHKRCWAPFGFLPFFINLPTYLKMASQKIKMKKGEPTACMHDKHSLQSQSLNRSSID